MKMLVKMGKHTGISLRNGSRLEQNDIEQFIPGLPQVPTPDAGPIGPRHSKWN